MNRIDLERRHAVVTGGARGIGLAIARRYLQSGASVALWDLGGDALAAALRELEPLGAVRAAVVDVRDEAQIGVALRRSIEEFGRVDILVNNAGILGPTVATWETTPAQWREVMAINLDGAFLCCRAVVPQMRAAGWGRIVNVASVAGKEGNPMNAAYSASKAAMISLTKSLGKELAKDGVLVNCITPSSADTAIFAGIPAEHQDDLRKFLLARVPMGRFVEVDEVAALAAWLVSPDCSFSTGAAFDITGGRAVY